MQRLVALSFLTVMICEAYAQRIGSESNPHVLNPSPSTVVWGNYWSETTPVLRIKSGDWVRVHTLLTSSPTRLERMGLAPEEVEQQLRDVQSVTDRGPGGHILTGPITIAFASCSCTAT